MPRSQQHPGDYMLKPGEVKKMIWACDDFRDRCIIKTLVYAGLRREELADLDVQDLDFERNRIFVRAGKGDKSRVVPVSPSVMVDLKHLVANRQKGPVFLSQKKCRISTRHINRIVNGAGEKAGIKHPDPKRKTINPHLLRHTLSRYLLDVAKVDVRHVQYILGHRRIQTTTEIYGTPSVDRIQESYDEKVEGVFG